MSASRPCGHLCPGFADIRSGPGPLFSGLTKFASRSRICFHLHRAFTVARPHRHPGTAAARHPHPFAPFTAHSARKGFALRLAVSPLRLRLFTGLVCRHGAGNPVWPHYTGDKHAQIPNDHCRPYRAVAEIPEDALCLGTFWLAEDFLSLDPSLTDEDIEAAMEIADDQHDAEVGFNWYTLEMAIERMRE